MAQALYLPNVTGTPADLTVPSREFRRSVSIVFCSLLLFLIFYLALACGCLYLIRLAFTMPLTSTDNSVLYARLILGVAPALLLLFLVKGLFKRTHRRRDLYLEVTEAEQPELFDYLRRLCADTRAPFPRKVYLTPDVNAAVTYDTSILNLVLPLKKDLVIGLGLVNQLTLGELKAVLAHEFGHFSQSSLRLGIYVYTANRIIGDMVYARDFFDELLRGWRRLDIRLSAIAWLLYGIVWVLRKILEAAFRAINWVDASLSRQMEFHADLVAVSVSGSDMIVHALKRLEFADACMDQALGDLKEAADHKLYTSDLYYHQARAGAYLRDLKNEPDLGQPPALPGDPKERTEVFEEGSAGAPSMWASHPPNHDRERNAKATYIRSTPDDRPAWDLFRDRDALCSTVTRKFYEHHLQIGSVTGYTPAEQVQAFIDHEHAEIRQDPRYAGLYDGRLLEIAPADLDQAAALPGAWGRPSILAVVDKLYKAEYKQWLEKHDERYHEFRLLTALKAGDLKPKGKTFPFRDQQRSLRDVPVLLESVDKELEQDRAWFGQLDVEVLQAHIQMARITGDADDLIERYRFHLHLQQILRTAGQNIGRLNAGLEYLRSKRDGLKQAEMAQVRGLLNEVRSGLVEAVSLAGTMRLPSLRNMVAGARLSEFLLTEAVVAPPADRGGISGDWINALMKQLTQVQGRARRLHFKSLGALLARQEAIAAAWSESPIPAPTVPAMPSRPQLEYDF